MTATSSTAASRPPCRRRARIPLAALVVALAATAAACAPTVGVHGNRLDEEALARIQPGQTTQQEVLQLLGSPSTVGTFDGEAWYYISRRTEHRSFYQNDVVAQDVVAITFNGQGVVDSLDRRGLEDARSIQPVSRTTPTAGNELSLIEQLIGNVGRFDARDADAPGSTGPGG